MFDEEIDETESMTRVKESEIPLAETTEHLQFLVNHFRKLANDKDSVISQYRDVLERLKPYHENERRLNTELMVYQHEVSVLRKQLSELKRKFKSEKDYLIEQIEKQSKE